MPNKSPIYAPLTLHVSGFASTDRHNIQHCPTSFNVVLQHLVKNACMLCVFKQHNSYWTVLLHIYMCFRIWSICSCFMVLYVPILVAFDDEHCWEPYMAHGNFSSSDISYQLGTIVTFACSPGFVLEQGSATIECIGPSNPHWNDSEPVCKGNFQSLSFVCTMHSTIFANISCQLPFWKFQPTLPLKPTLSSRIQQGYNSF